MLLTLGVHLGQFVEVLDPAILPFLPPFAPEGCWCLDLGSDVPSSVRPFISHTWDEPSVYLRDTTPPSTFRYTSVFKPSCVTRLGPRFPTTQMRTDSIHHRESVSKAGLAAVVRLSGAANSSYLIDKNNVCRISTNPFPTR